MLQQTVEEQERHLHWHRRRRRAMTPRRLLQESDELLFWVEECLVQETRIVPGWLVARLMVVLRHAHAERPLRPGRAARPEQLKQDIYDAEAAHMEQACWRRGPGEVIALFVGAREVMLREPLATL